ncbi:MAG: hypothetical protein Q4C77_05770 [Eubacteriales bacterium]|nr:hypothetical protein [Eubacteriales bacterium]
MNMFYSIMLGAAVFLLLFIFFWGLCAGSNTDMGIDEDEEQAEWFREYQREQQQKKEQKMMRRSSRISRIKH